MLPKTWEVRKKSTTTTTTGARLNQIAIFSFLWSVMAVGRWFVKVSLYLSSVILLSIILAPSYTEHGRITASSFLLASNGDKHCFPNRNSGLSRQYCISQRVSPSWKVRVGVNFAKLSMFAGYLVLLAGDVSSNPGPSIQLESKASKCAFCSKILRKNQPRMACMSCKRFFHLSCLGDGFEVTRFCHQCLENDSGAEESRTSLSSHLSFGRF